MSAVVGKVTVSFGRYELTISPKTISGDNPRFYAQQVEEQLQDVAEVFRAVAGTVYGAQEPKR